MRAPLPAASIMTPMMLFAFTLRPLRASETSHWYFAASCVSLAEARACRPSLLTTSTSCCRIEGIGFDVQNPVAASADGLLDHRVEIAITIGDRSHKHRQVDPGHGLDLARDEQLRCKVARRRAVDIREDEHAVARVQTLCDLSGLAQQL